jgi:catechol 2,3-dioxygenase-like lactoylglutathione lyase family enzyme
MEPRISIITFGVADLERSYRFYEDSAFKVVGGAASSLPVDAGDGVAPFQDSANPARSGLARAARTWAES